MAASPSTPPAGFAAAERLKAFNEDKFGMFIHWGPYARLAGEYKDQKSERVAEWIQLQFKIPGAEYEEVARGFDPVRFDAEEWVRLAKDAGMKYIVITSKHHDGFCMFVTRRTNYNIVDFTPFRRDPIKELAAACAKHGLRLGLYYSIVDWHHPEFPPQYSNHDSQFHGFQNANADIGKYADYQLAQVHELLTNYGPISVIWFDGGGSFRGADRYGLLKGDEMVRLIRELQPECLINNRIGGGKGDYGTPEQRIPGEVQDQAFEVCMTINTRWGWNKFDKNFKPSKDLIRKLIDIAHKGGSFLLNVGPDGEGAIVEEFASRLRDMGAWLRANGESIYGTKNSVFAELVWGRSTTRLLDDGVQARLYLHVFDWPRDGFLLAPGLDNKPLQAFLLAKGPRAGRLEVEKTAQGVKITGLPAGATDETATVIALDVEGTPQVRQSQGASPSGSEKRGAGGIDAKDQSLA